MEEQENMEYFYSENENFEDFSSGRVLCNAKGVPNFPVRLLIEIYYRAKSYHVKKENLVIYDPCCGGGSALTLLGMFDNQNIRKIYGSDVDPTMLAFAKRNLRLLSHNGMENRKQELAQLYEAHHKPAHQEALASCERLARMLKTEIQTELFTADCTKPLPAIHPDLIFTDVPYGNLVEWADTEGSLSIEQMLEQVWNISNPHTVLAVCMDKKQKIEASKWKRMEKHNVGKRKFEIFQKTESFLNF